MVSTVGTVCAAALCTFGSVGAVFVGMAGAVGNGRCCWCGGR